MDELEGPLYEAGEAGLEGDVAATGGSLVRRHTGPPLLRWDWVTAKGVVPAAFSVWVGFIVILFDQS